MSGMPTSLNRISNSSFAKTVRASAPLDEHVSVFVRLAAGELDREGFRAWVSVWIAVK